MVRLLIGALGCSMWMLGAVEGRAQPPASVAAGGIRIVENPVRKLLHEGKFALGPGLRAPSPEVAATLAGAGFDFLWIDMEHGSLTIEHVRNMILATRGMRAVPLVRVPANEPWMAKRALDMGALGIIFPFTSTRELAEQAVGACRYPPAGRRGFGPNFAATHWGMTLGEYVAFAQENVLVIVMIEDRQALEQIDEIVAVPGIDAIFIGANDLSYSLGKGGRLTDPIVEAAVARILEAARRHRLPVGYPAGSGDEIAKRTRQGFQLILSSNDMVLLTTGAQHLISAVEQQLKSGSPAPNP